MPIYFKQDAKKITVNKNFLLILATSVLLIWPLFIIPPFLSSRFKRGYAGGNLYQKLEAPSADCIEPVLLKFFNIGCEMVRIRNLQGAYS